MIPTFVKRDSRRALNNSIRNLRIEAICNQFTIDLLAGLLLNLG